MSVFFFRIFSFQIIFYGLAAIATAILNSYRRFIICTFAPIVNNIVVILTFFIFYIVNKNNPTLALYILAIGTTLGVVSLFAIQIPSLAKVWIGYKLSFNFRHPAIKKLLLLSIPLFVYVATNVFQMVVEKNIIIAAINLDVITPFVYSWTLFQLPYGIFAVSIITALFPDVSKHIATGKTKELKSDISLGIRMTSFIMIPAAVIFAVLSYPICELVLERGNFDKPATIMTAQSLTGFSIGLFSFAIFMYLLKVFYAKQDTITPTIVNLASTALTIVADLILVRYFRIGGVAFGRSIGFTFSAIVLFYLLRKKIGPLGAKKIILSVLKFVISGLFMGISAYLSFVYLASIFPALNLINKVIILIVPATLGIIIYIIFGFFLKVEELNLALRALKIKKG